MMCKWMQNHRLVNDALLYFVSGVISYCRKPDTCISTEILDVVLHSSIVPAREIVEPNLLLWSRCRAALLVIKYGLALAT